MDISNTMYTDGIVKVLLRASHNLSDNQLHYLNQLCTLVDIENDRSASKPIYFLICNQNHMIIAYLVRSY